MCGFKHGRLSAQLTGRLLRLLQLSLELRDVEPQLIGTLEGQGISLLQRLLVVAYQVLLPALSSQPQI